VEGKQLKISIERENIHHVNNNHKVKRIYTSQMRVECKMKRNVTGKGHENGLRISMKEIININGGKLSVGFLMSVYQPSRSSGRHFWMAAFLSFLQICQTSRDTL